MTIAHALIQVVLEKLREENWLPHDVFSVEMSLEESLANAVHHGNGGDETKKVTFACSLTKKTLKVQVRDEGPGFDFENLRDPRTPENINKATGRGVLLIHHFMTRVHYNDRGNCVFMEKERGTLL
ncbi:MAG: ATP-binding protein [Thermoguttaceae bacterium]